MDAASQEMVNTLEAGCPFWFLNAERIKASSGPLPRHQQLRKQKGWLRDHRIGIHECMSLVFINYLAAISYVWQTPEHPDPDGEQADALRKWLRMNPAIAWVWVDWGSLPQNPRSPGEEEEFRNGLSVVNIVYLSCRVLKIVNAQFLGRLWPQYECWLSFQKLRRDGALTHACARSEITFTGWAADSEVEAEHMENQLQRRWAEATVDNAIAHLDKKDVHVTNQRDKDSQLVKIQQFLTCVRTSAGA